MPVPFEAGTPLLQGIRLAQERAGRRMILGTPVLNVDDTPAARREAAREIAQSRKNGAAFCLIHHSSAEQLVNKNKKMLGRLPDYRRASMDELPQAWNTLKGDMSIVGPRPMMPEEIELYGESFRDYISPSGSGLPAYGKFGAGVRRP